MIRARVALVAILVAIASPAFAVDPDEVLADPALEARARDLSAELRCLVCQNQSIDDSNASLAKDLRVLIRQRLEAGDDDAEVIDFVVARYGEFVLLRPRFAPHTWALWFGPPIILALGALIIVASFRRRRKDAPEAEPGPLSAQEQKKLRRIMDES